MQIKDLGETFKRHAGRMRSALFTNRLSGFFFRHAGWIGMAGYAGGNATLMLKDGLQLVNANGGFNYDGAAGLFSLLGTLALPLTNSKKHGDLAFRLNGIAGLIGIGLLAYSGWHNNGAAAHDLWKTFSPMVGWGTTAALTMMQKEINQLADRAKESKYRLLRAFGKVAGYPVAYGAALDGGSVAGLLKSAFNNHDWKMKIACMLWGAGVGGFAATDRHLQKTYRVENHIPEPPEPEP